MGCDGGGAREGGTREQKGAGCRRAGEESGVRGMGHCEGVEVVGVVLGGKIGVGDVGE